MRIIRMMWQYFLLASMGLVLTACVTTVTRGHLKEDEALASIHPGTTTQNEALKALGSPSSQSTFGPNSWYYISTIRQTRSLFAPRISDQHVTEITFDESGVVSNMKEYSLADAKDVEMASRVTPAEGQQLGFIEQVFGNVGRFNKDTSSTSNDHGGGGAGTRSIRR